MGFGSFPFTNQTRPWNFEDGDGVVQVANLVWNGNAWVRETQSSSSSGGLTDAELRATAVPISGTVSANLNAGTNNIGDVDVLSIAAGTNKVGGVYSVGGQLIDEVPTLRTVNRAFANPTGTGNTEVVAAQASGIRIRVLAVIVVSTLANIVKFQSATTDISASYPLAANGGFVLPMNPHGWFETAAAAALNINLSVATATGVNVVWVQST